MSTVFDAILSLPTAAYGALFALMTGYWLLSLSGIFDLDLFEGAGLEAGGLDAGLDGAVDGGLDPTPGFMERTGFGEIPRSILLTMISFFGFFFSLAAIVALERSTGWTPETGVAQAAVGGAMLVLATGATALAVQPLRRAMEANLGPTRGDLVGGPCTIKTARVDDSFGQAELDDGDQLVQVRDPIGLGLGLGARALVYGYDPEREVFLVTSLDPSADPRNSSCP
ncbi:MAG: hypothetical protein AAGC60_07950 [Acidobacteriota bacterium]